MVPKPSSVPDLDAVGIKKAPQEVANVLKPILAAALHRNAHQFPGAQPVSFARRHIQALKERDYWVCEKSDGVRVLLFMTVDDEGREAHYFIDRKNDYYLVPYLGFHAPLAPPTPDAEVDFASFHHRSVLDGELLWDTYPPDGRRVLKYLVFDCMTLEGEDMTQRTLDKRLAYFGEKIWAPYDKLLKMFPDDCSFLFQMEKKNFQLSYGTEMMFKDIMPGLKHACDGLIFTCRETPYKYGTDENILKWKKPEENTIDFRMKMEFPPAYSNGTAHEPESELDRDYDAMPKFQLYMYAGQDSYEHFAEMYVEPDEWEAMKRYAVERNDGLEEAVVECKKDASGRWRFGRWREDKNDVSSTLLDSSSPVVLICTLMPSPPTVSIANKIFPITKKRYVANTFIQGNHHTVVRKVQESIDDGVSDKELMAESAAIRAAWKKRNAR